MHRLTVASDSQMPVEKTSGRQTHEEADVKLEEEEAVERSGHQLLLKDVVGKLQEQEDEGLWPREPHSVQQVEEIATQAAD